MDDGGSDVMTWDEINARENGTDGFFGHADEFEDPDIDEEYETTGDLDEQYYYDQIDEDRYQDDFGDY